MDLVILMASGGHQTNENVSELRALGMQRMLTQTVPKTMIMTASTTKTTNWSIGAAMSKRSSHADDFRPTDPENVVVSCQMQRWLAEASQRQQFRVEVHQMRESTKQRMKRLCDQIASLESLDMAEHGRDSIYRAEMLEDGGELVASQMADKVVDSKLGKRRAPQMSAFDSGLDRVPARRYEKSHVASHCNNVSS